MLATMTTNPLLDRIGRVAEYGFYGLAVSVLAGAYTPLAVGGALAPATQLLGNMETNPYSTLAHWLTLFGLAVVLACHWRRLVPMLRHSGWIGCWLGLAALSGLWSQAPEISVRRTITAAESLALGYCLLLRLGMVDSIRLFARMLVLAALASALVALAFPGLGVMIDSIGWQAQGEHLQGAWAGVFSHRNELGAAMVIGALSCGWLAWYEPRRWRHRLGLLICVVVAVKTYSSTTMLMLVLMPLLAALRRAMRLGGVRRLWLVWAFGIGAALITAFFTLFYSDAMEALGRDASMTGRVPLWGAVLDGIGHHPLLGYGYSAFWQPDNPAALRVWFITGWQMFEAHEGYLEAMLDFGIPGLVLLVLIIGTIIARSVRVTEPWASFAWLYITMFMLVNLSESSSPVGVNRMLLTLIYTALAMAVAGQRQAAPATPRRAGQLNAGAGLGPTQLDPFQLHH